MSEERELQDPMTKIKLTDAGIDCEFTDDIVCPWCGHRHEDTPDWYPTQGRDTAGGQCDSCGKHFEYTLNVETSWCSVKAQKPEEWFERYGMRVLDPDGWRDEGRDFDEPLPYESFRRLAMRSTCVPLDEQVAK